MKRQSRPPLVRMYAIDEELRKNSYPNCRVLAEYFEVNPKTIQRDIEYMRVMLGAPIIWDFKRKGYFYEKAWMFLPSIFLKEREAEAMLVTKRVLQQYDGTPYYSEISRALDKVLQCLPDAIPADSFFNVYSFESPVTTPGSLRLFTELEDGIRQHMKVSVLYSAPTTKEVTRRVIHPYRLHYANATWYLLAWCELRQDIRAFVVSRMKEVKLMLDESFAMKKDFDPDVFISGMFFQQVGPDVHQVKIRFSADIAPWILERRWHNSQELTVHEDGSLTLVMRVSSLEAVQNWVLSYGEEAEVLEPDMLCRMVYDRAQGVSRLYRRSASE